VRFASKAPEEEKVEEIPREVLYAKIKTEFEKKESAEVLSEELKTYKNELKELKPLCKEKIPDELSCPLTGEIFFDPVIAGDGHTYERLAIATWLEKENTSPLDTKLSLSKDLIPNQSIKKMVKKYYDSHKDVLQKIIS